MGSIAEVPQTSDEDRNEVTVLVTGFGVRTAISFVIAAGGESHVQLQPQFNDFPHSLYVFESARNVQGVYSNRN